MGTVCFGSKYDKTMTHFVRTNEDYLLSIRTPEPKLCHFIYDPKNLPLSNCQGLQQCYKEYSKRLLKVQDGCRVSVSGCGCYYLHVSAAVFHRPMDAPVFLDTFPYPLSPFPYLTQAHSTPAISVEWDCKGAHTTTSPNPPNYSLPPITSLQMILLPHSVYD